ncbi:unnamed protein product [Lactuca saligna]|uniref:PB1 domain-containing protein n=1 Tax=Lactuca saligna TaxID=75948 RepID=A0AA36ED48_LACSI|nr:unnamed protein product [Lactuca saligna]
MENNYSCSSYPDSNTSTPRSREVDCETASYDEQLANNNNPNPNPNPNNNASNYKVKLMCSYGGKILPRPHDNQLTYIGGDTKILTVDRNIRYALILQKLGSLSDSTDICFKYQLPGEDLDALISVTNDEDLEHMMTEYDRIFRSSVKPVRLRLFLFPLSPSSYGSGGESKTEQQWFVDALNAVQISSAQASSPASESPDFLFGFDKGNAPVQAPSKVQDVAAVVVPQANVSEGARPESECGSEDSNSNRLVISDPVVSPTVEIQRQIQESQRMQIAASHEQAMNIDPRAYYGDYYTQKIQPAPATGQPRYWQEQRHMTTGGYTMSVAGTDSPVYLIPSSNGVYSSQAPSPAPAAPAGQTLRPATVQVNQGQAYYGMQRMVNQPEFYREQPMYSTMTQTPIQQQKIGTYQEAIGMVRPQAEMGYGQVGIDATGRQVYYTTSQGGMPTSYQPVVAGPGLAVNQEGKMVVNHNKAP